MKFNCLKKAYNHLLCTIYNKIKSIIRFIMFKYIKYFEKHEDYEDYINSIDRIMPNVSFCKDMEELHYNIEKNLKSKVDASTSVRLLYIDDFPDDVCESMYNNDMTAFKQDFINDFEKANEYKYTGEMFEYNGNEYYLWEYQPKVEDDSRYERVNYIITDTLDFTGHSLEENINSDYCPFIAKLGDDKTPTYLGSNLHDTYLIASRNGVKIVNDVDAISEIIVDGTKLPNVVDYYDFGDDDEHDITFTFVDPTIIEDYAFYGCTGLTTIDIPNTVEYIGNSSFQLCTGLTGNLFIPSSVKSLGEDAFQDCSGLTSIQIGTGLSSIPDGAFQDCSGLTGTLVIPDNVEAIGDFAFGNCSNITGLQIGKGLSSLGPDTFLGCISLETIVVDENNEWFDSRNDCNALIDLDGVVLRVGSKNTVIPNGIFEIGEGAFNGLPITTMTIPSSITYIHYGAFKDCSQLASVTVEATTPPRLSQEVFINNASGRKIYVPSASLAAYQAASGWSDYAADIEAIS